MSAVAVSDDFVAEGEESRVPAAAILDPELGEVDGTPEVVDECAAHVGRGSTSPVDVSVWTDASRHGAVQFGLVVSSPEATTFCHPNEPQGPRTLNVYRLNPLSDRRWANFIETQRDASVFHTQAWLDAIRRMYGCEPVVYTTSPPAAEVTNGVVLCHVRSWLTGHRMVSVPFADHCDPLVDGSEEWDAILDALRRQVMERVCTSIELRPRRSHAPARGDWQDADTFCFHAIDLRASLDNLYAALHPESIRRKLRRSVREGLTYDEGRSEALLDHFYRLLLLTRRRHQLPPQPREWFSHLAACFGNRLTVHTASADGVPVAAILTLRHASTLVYKYGASDARFHKAGTMPLLFWNAVCSAKHAGLASLDLGRSSSDNAGLIAFKDHLGAARSMATYLTFPPRAVRTSARWMPLAMRIFARMPDRVLIASGKLLYRHIG